MYEPNCGITKLKMSWGHDEYLYHVLKHNKSTLPEQALYIIVSLEKFLYFISPYRQICFIYIEIPFILSMAHISRLYSFRGTR